jgi:hypothetical protein
MNMSLGVYFALLRFFLTAVPALTTLALIPTAPAFAQADECAPNPGVRNELASLRSVDDKVRIAAATSLTGKGAATLPTAMAELKNFRGSTDNLSTAEQSYFVSITDILRTIVSNSTAAITQFRKCDDPSVIKPLIWAAKGANPNMRVNSTLVLGNVIDNTTVCFVLHHLVKDDRITTNGRANLLGVTVAMASYAYRENADEIGIMLGKIEQVPSLADLVQTQNLIVEIGRRVQGSTNRGTSLNPTLPKFCYQYDYNGPLD